MWQTFSREELYDLVWSTPMRTLADKHGISGTGLAKVCRKHGIPVPERGYWNKIQAGHVVSKKPLPPRKAPRSITINPLGPRRPEPEPEPILDSVATAIDAARSKLANFVISASSHHPIVEAWIREYRKDKKQRQWQHPEDPIKESELSDRRLRVCSTMFKAFERLGWKIVPGESRFWGVKLLHGKAELTLDLRERLAQVKKRITAEQKASRFYRPGQEWTQIKVPTGELRAKVKSERYYLAKEWSEATGSSFDLIIPEIVSGIAGVFEELSQIEQRHADEARQRLEEERRSRAEAFEHKRERVRLHRLIQQCADWKSSEDIRAFVRSVEHSNASSDMRRFEIWKSWALAQADELDPRSYEDLLDLSVDDSEVWHFKE